MKQTLQSKQTLKQNLIFNTALYDSLAILKLSGFELIESIFAAVQENPLLEIKENLTFSYENVDAFRTISKPENLKDYLYAQLHTCTYEYNESICNFLIESLDRHGFFVENLEECAYLLHVTGDELKVQLSIIQSFEPCGVAATNCIHALALQAKALHQMRAYQILNDCIYELSKKQYNKIAKILHCKEKEVFEAIQCIQTLSPYPCSSFPNEDEGLIFPDLKLEIVENKLNLIPTQYVTLHYHDDYLSLMDTNPILKEYFEQSKVFISNIDKRNATMMLVANEIMNRQSGYFLYQDELKPLKQGDIAQTLGINQTTVSRAVMGKYYEFENNIYPISHLFVTATTKGDSSDAIKKAIKDILSSEDKHHPYSDVQIVEKLKDFEYKVSRRTVTKYRESCGIPSTRERKKH